MDIVLTIIAFLVIFSLLVLIHEAGHFWMAKRAGIKVLEFGFGYPPRIFGKKKGETLYSINAVPFGGFVRMHGEDSSNASVLKDKRSFASKSPWVRTKVLAGGVFMNFVLAIVLLTIGFSFGIEPLLVTEQDLFNHIAQGNVVSAPGAFVSKVDDKAGTLGIKPKDQIIAIDGKPVTSVSQLDVFLKGKAKKDVDLVVRAANGSEKKVHVPMVGKGSYLGVDLKPFTEFPRLYVLEVKAKSASEKAGLKPGDIILKMNSEEVYFPADFETILTESEKVNFTVLRGSKVLNITVTLPDAQKVVIAEVSENSAAAKAGFKKDDIIVSIANIVVTRPESVQEILKKNPGKEMEYSLIRGSKPLKIKATSGANNLLGIALSSVASFKNTEISVYRGSLLTSIVEIKNVRYAPWTAFKQAISESVRLTGITVAAFVNSIKSIVSKFVVPAEMGGPVQIAYYTHTFVQQGFFALLRFTALLSLSLAVINILPVPALDGGRLLFVVIEVLFKKRVNAQLEALVHSIGFILLILLILLVTYSDIMKLI